MKFVQFAFFAAILLTSCADSPRECNNLVFAARHATEVARGNDISYIHQILVKDYDDRCFNDYNFIRIIRDYMDTNQVLKPVKGVVFYKEPGADWYKDRSKLILAVTFSDSSLNYPIPTMSSLRIGPNGKYELDFMYMLPVDSSYLINK